MSSEQPAPEAEKRVLNIGSERLRGPEVFSEHSAVDDLDAMQDGMDPIHVVIQQAAAMTVPEIQFVWNDNPTLSIERLAREGVLARMIPVTTSASAFKKFSLRKIWFNEPVIRSVAEELGWMGVFDLQTNLLNAFSSQYAYLPVSRDNPESLDPTAIINRTEFSTTVANADTFFPTSRKISDEDIFVDGEVSRSALLFSWPAQAFLGRADQERVVYKYLTIRALNMLRPLIKDSPGVRPAYVLDVYRATHNVPLKKEGQKDPILNFYFVRLLTVDETRLIHSNAFLRPIVDAARKSHAVRSDFGVKDKESSPDQSSADGDAERAAKEKVLAEVQRQALEFGTRYAQPAIDRLKASKHEILEQQRQKELEERRATKKKGKN